MKDQNLTIQQILKKNNDIYARAIKEAIARQMASITNSQQVGSEDNKEE